MQQQELFSEEVGIREEEILIPGFKLQKDYISREEEAELICHVEQGPWESSYRRRIQQYGLGYSSEGSEVAQWVRDFPGWLVPLAERVRVDAPMERFPENCVVNEYMPPLGIGGHRDYADFGNTVACVSLGSDIVMDLTNPSENQRVPIHVPARSLWVITGEARWKWLHGIAERLTDKIRGERRERGRRISLTFRTGKTAVATNKTVA